MKKILLNLSGRARFLKENLTHAIRAFSKKQRVVFFAFIWIFVISSFVALWNINKYFLIEVPSSGGSLTEGVIGAPRFINPVLAISDADRDLSKLVYSGLMRATKDGTLVPDMAKSYSVSKDGVLYTFILKDNLTFHDGKPVTADDIEFTIKKVQDPATKSPKRASWDGVEIQKINDKEIRFLLSKPYAPFLENTTIGILPKHIWENIEPEQLSFSQFNIDPVGSGPYKIKTIKRDGSGIPVYYDLAPFKHFSFGKPYIKNIRIKFYSNEEKLFNATVKKEIDSTYALDPKYAEKLGSKYNILTHPMPRVFGLFFNQNQAEIFTDISVRKALNKAVDKKMIIEEVLYGYGNAISGPIPPGSLGYRLANKNRDEKQTPDNNASTTDKTKEAISILEKNGWKRNKEDGIMEKKNKKGTMRLKFSISTSNVPELKDVAEKLKSQWEAIGAQIEIKVFETSDLNQNVIRPRKYDSLLFGEIIGRGSDLFAFWHSSQRNDPGLNIASYANITVDKLLENIRSTRKEEDLEEKYEKLQEEIKNDIPAIFIYTPDFIYVIPKKIKGVELGSLSTPSDRFLNIYNWFIETDKVWKIFLKSR